MMAAVTPAMPLRWMPFVRGLAPAVALALAVGTASGPARAAAPTADFEQLIAQADEHAGKGRHAEALAAYAKAFEAMPPELKASGVGEFVAMAAGNAALEGYRARGDRTALEDGRAVLVGFIEAAKAADPATGPAPTDAAEQRLAEIEAQLPADAEPTEPPTPTSEPDPEVVAPPEQDAAPARKGLGLGLVIAGGAAALAGGGLLIVGAQQVSWYQHKLAEEGWAPDDPGYLDQIAEAERTRNLDFGLGAAFLVVGVGVGVAGAVILVKGKRRAREAALVPVLGRDRAMLAATLRF
jgi:hypothetical protein